MAEATADPHGVLAPLPLPLPSLGAEISATPEQLAALTSDALATEATWGLGATLTTHLSQFTVAPVGSLLIASGRTTPVAVEYKPASHLIVVMGYAGASRFLSGGSELRSMPGDVLVFPGGAGTLCGGLHAGISFSLEQERLLRTARSILGSGRLPGPDAPFHIGGGLDQGLLFSLFRHLDCVFRQDRHLPAALALDDQIYRTLIHAYARTFRLSVRTPRPMSAGCSAALDDLVDFIRAHACERPLTLTDLELHSHCSARHLQVLFRQRFDCSPMQFVRRQRLNAAMLKLQLADWHDSVTRIARDCGYRYTSNFSTDFLREFGVSPSVVLRSSRLRRP